MNAPEVVVIGGGPAGTTAATLLAKQGHSVQLFERERFPRYHIGESLIPMTYHVLERLDMLPKMKGSRFVKKYSVQFVNRQGKLSEPFYFLDHKPHEESQTWQVYRKDFDQMMLDNAREHGVAVREGVRALNVIFDGDRAVGVRIQDDAGEREVRAKVVVDASGQSTMLMDRFKLREWDDKLKKAALWTYWENAYRDTGKDEGATLVMQTEGKKGWFWYIPLHGNMVSVGVVADYTYLFTDRADKDFEKTYFEEVARCPGLKGRLDNARRADQFRAAKEYSYRAKRAAGDGWVLVGDAYGFLDPLYSSGVLLALRSGAMAADAIADGLATNDLSAAQLGRWEPTFAVGMDRMRSLVCSYYEGFSFGRFVSQYPHYKGLLTDLLIGDLFEDRFGPLFRDIEAARAEFAAGKV